MVHRLVLLVDLLHLGVMVRHLVLLVDLLHLAVKALHLDLLEDLHLLEVVHHLDLLGDLHLLEVAHHLDLILLRLLEVVLHQDPILLRLQEVVLRQDLTHFPHLRPPHLQLLIPLQQFLHRQTHLDLVLPKHLEPVVLLVGVQVEAEVVVQLQEWEVKPLKQFHSLLEFVLLIILQEEEEEH